MALSHGSDPDDEEILRYLLGLLTEDQAEWLDQLSTTSDDVAWRVRVVENDLVDAYVSGALDEGTRERFEELYVGPLASARRREKERFARSLLRRESPGAPAHTETGCPSPKAPAARGVAGRARPVRWRRVARGALADAA
jgi:hypothetical protein